METKKHTGKSICRELKALRRRIAEQNNIPLHIPECTYEGPCCGTCPRCEAELHTLERALEQRMRLGKVAMVAGVMLTMALTQTAMAQEPVRPDAPLPAQHVVDTCRLYGTVKDLKTGEPLPFANVFLIRNGAIIKSVRSDLDGRFSIPALREHYELGVSYLGYQEKRVVVDLTHSFDLSMNIDFRLKYDSKLGTEELPITAGIITSAGDLFEIGNTTSGGRISSERLDRFPSTR